MVRGVVVVVVVFGLGGGVGGGEHAGGFDEEGDGVADFG